MPFLPKRRKAIVAVSFETLTISRQQIAVEAHWNDVMFILAILKCHMTATKLAATNIALINGLLTSAGSRTWVGSVHSPFRWSIESYFEIPRKWLFFCNAKEKVLKISQDKARNVLEGIFSTSKQIAKICCSIDNFVFCNWSKQSKSLWSGYASHIYYKVQERKQVKKQSFHAGKKALSWTGVSSDSFL